MVEIPAQPMTRETAVKFLTDIFCDARVSLKNAQSVARALVDAEIDGQKGHGFSRVPSYLAQARSGKVDGNAETRIEKTGDAFLSVDAGHGFAFPAIDNAIEALKETAPNTGIAAAGIFRSHHCGQLGAHVERLARSGFLSIMVANSPKAMAPWGGNAPLFGTNPIAFAAPRRSEPPLVVDLSLSKVARGKIMAAAQTNDPIPEGIALDEEGNPTTDANRALKGSMIPLGDAKGAALALMVEILSGALIGANASYQASSFFDAEGDPPGVGHLLIAIDGTKVGGAGYFDRIEHLLTTLLAQDGTRLPGERRFAARAACDVNGIKIAPDLLQKITSQ